MGVLVYSCNSTLGRWKQKVIHIQIHSKFKGNLDYMKPYFKRRGERKLSRELCKVDMTFLCWIN